MSEPPIFNDEGEQLCNACGETLSRSIPADMLICKLCEIAYP